MEPDWLQRLRFALSGAGNPWPNDTTVVRRGDLREGLTLIDEVLKRREVGDMVEGAQRDTLDEMQRRHKT